MASSEGGDERGPVRQRAGESQVRSGDGREGPQGHRAVISTRRATALTGLLLCVSIAGAQDIDAGKGYHPCPCGLDLTHVVVFGGDVVYVDSRLDSDDTGDGSAERPYATIAYVLASVDGSDGDGAYTICIAGTFHETVTLTRSGAPGHYERDGCQYPTQPAMIVGWDRDGE
jgi:hypothetical protein